MFLRLILAALRSVDDHIGGEMFFTWRDVFIILTLETFMISRMVNYNLAVYYSTSLASYFSFFFSVVSIHAVQNEEKK